MLSYAKLVSTFIGILLLINPAYAWNEVEYQAAWKLGEIEQADPQGLIGHHKRIYSVSLQPVKLFRTSTALFASEGVTLMGPGTQLVLMDAGQKRMICSLERGARGSLSEMNRVCLLDSDADGTYDRFFTRTFRPGIFVGEGQILGMAGNLGPTLPLEPATVEEIDPSLFASSPKLSVIYETISDSDRKTFIYTKIGGIVTMPDGCTSYLADGASVVALSQCKMPGATVRVIRRTGKMLQFVIMKTPEAARIRFRFIKGLFDYSIFAVQISPL